MGTEETSTERFLRLVIGYTLWLISGFMTVSLYLELAGSSWISRVLFVLIAVCLEGAKILLWRSRGRMSQAIGLLLVALSLLASFGETLVSLSKSEQRNQSLVHERLIATPQYQSVLTDIQSYDRQIEEGLNRVSKYPSNYYSLARQELNVINGLREEKGKAMKELQAFESEAMTNENDDSMFSVMAKVSHIDSKFLRLFVSMLIAICIEFGAILLTRRNDLQGKKKKPRTGARMECPTVGPDGALSESEKKFILAAQNDATYPFLNGRDRTAKKLGLSCYEGKKIVQSLIDKGVIEVRQKRLLVVQQKRPCSA